jgi:hypothetical protein
MTWKKYNKEVRKALKKYGVGTSEVDDQTIHDYFEDSIDTRTAAFQIAGEMGAVDIFAERQ